MIFLFLSKLHVAAVRFSVDLLVVVLDTLTIV
jgi:hypothetical protein